MTMKKVYYLDSNICIFHLRKPYSNLSEKINSTNHYSCIKIPIVVKGELLVGAVKSAKPKENVDEIETFCKPFEIVSFDDFTVKTYAKIRASLERKGQKIGANDTIIAAIVLARNGVLVTNNVKEFSRVEGLQIEDWIQEEN